MGFEVQIDLPFHPGSVTVELDTTATTSDLYEAFRRRCPDVPFCSLFFGEHHIVSSTSTFVADTGITAESVIKMVQAVDWMEHSDSLVHDGDTLRLTGSNYHVAFLSPPIESGCHEFSLLFRGGTNGAALGYIDEDAANAVLQNGCTGPVYTEAYCYTNHGDLVREGHPVTKKVVGQFTSNDVVSCRLDMPQRRVLFAKNGEVKGHLDLIDENVKYRAVMMLYTTGAEATLVHDSHVVWDA